MLSYDEFMEKYHKNNGDKNEIDEEYRDYKVYLNADLFFSESIPKNHRLILGIIFC